MNTLEQIKRDQLYAQDIGRFTPSTVEAMLHCYYSGERHPERGKQWFELAVTELCRLGLLMPDRGACNGVSATPRGCAWVEMICRTPLPVERTEWVDPRPGGVEFTIQGGEVQP